ncbi:MAG: carbohydrate ABC transporter permease [Spirochaetia bacterium]|nr:carbohydrate ABC transporter permease [Spirochaetia bacterium]
MNRTAIAGLLSKALLITGSLLILLPMYVLIVTAMKTQAESSVSFFSLPRSLYFDNFLYVMRTPFFFRNTFNSAVITAGTVAGIIIFAPLTSYAIGKQMAVHRGYRFLYYYFTIGLFIPFQVVMIPLIKLLSRFNMMSIPGIIILYITFSLMQGVFLLVGYYKAIPPSLEEAAVIDGASVIQSYLLIIFPLLKPMILTVVIMRGLFSWNDFFLPLLMLNNSREKWTLPLFQYNFKGEYLFDYSIAFASFLIALLPIMILYGFLQKQFISGLTSGAVKE